MNDKQQRQIEQKLKDVSVMRQSGEIGETIDVKYGGHWIEAKP